ncbi:MAG: restriction endonuclease subunit S, partial [Synergistaceae bacterium]|nr:restriction endonuclease subunit S [Synergistaceae bacterium]
MKKYDSYKDSGIEWIGEIPEHWEECRLGVIGGFTSSGIDKKIVEDEPTVKIINYTDVYGNKEKILNTEKDYMEVTSPQSKINQHSVKKGDLIFTPSSETKEDIGLSAVVVDDLDNTAFSYHVLRFQFNKEVNLLFKKYLCNNYPVLNYFSKNSKGTTRQILGREDFKNAKVVIPPKSEQTSIASFLDRKTSEIDDIIADKKRLLELYEEEKTAIINQAVTKGLDPNAPMKDSGIEWLGEIPEHWEVKKLKMLVSKVGSGVTPRGGSSVYLSIGIPLIRSQNVHFDGLKLDDVAFISEEVDEEMSNSRIQDGDVLLNITGASIGRCYFVPDGFGRGNVNQHVCIIRPNINEVSTVYLSLLLRSEIGQLQIRLQQTGANREGLNFEQLKNFYLPVATSLNEQQSIVHHIESECSKI